VLGSGLLSFGAIPPACYFAAASTRDNNRTTSISSSSHKQALKLRVWPVLRDTVNLTSAVACVQRVAQVLRSVVVSLPFILQQLQSIHSIPFFSPPSQVGYVGALIALGSILAKDGNHVGAGSALALVCMWYSHIAMELRIYLYTSFLSREAESLFTTSTLLLSLKIASWKLREFIFFILYVRWAII
jgi:hypothetical protein